MLGDIVQYLYASNMVYVKWQATSVKVCTHQTLHVCIFLVILIVACTHCPTTDDIIQGLHTWKVWIWQMMSTIVRGYSAMALRMKRVMCALTVRQGVWHVHISKWKMTSMACTHQCNMCAYGNNFYKRQATLEKQSAYQYGMWAMAEDIGMACTHQNLHVLISLATFVVECVYWKMSTVISHRLLAMDMQIWLMTSTKIRHNPQRNATLVMSARIGCSMFVYGKWYMSM